MGFSAPAQDQEVRPPGVAKDDLVGEAGFQGGLGLYTASWALFRNRSSMLSPLRVRTFSSSWR